MLPGGAPRTPGAYSRGDFIAPAPPGCSEQEAGPAVRRGGVIRAGKTMPPTPTSSHLRSLHRAPSFPCAPPGRAASPGRGGPGLLQPGTRPSRGGLSEVPPTPAVPGAQQEGGAAAGWHCGSTAGSEAVPGAWFGVEKVFFLFFNFFSRQGIRERGLRAGSILLRCAAGCDGWWAAAGSAQWCFETRSKSFKSASPVTVGAQMGLCRAM